jgi:protein-tyrosine kinase
MSRIDEALRQAGLRKEAGAPSGGSAAGLDNFPVGTESEVTAAPAAPQRTYTPPQPAPVQPAPVQLARSSSLSAEKLVIHDRTGPACVEQYRRVAATLHHLQEERGTKVLMVASARPGEGKTLTAANLGLTLSESYRRRVLLIDADLRRPSLNALFRLQNVGGLAETLKGTDNGPLRVLELSPYLSLLPGGRPDRDPMAGLTSGRMQQIIEQAASNYDWVIIDTPPIALQPDATLLAAMVEGTIMVVAAGTTPSALIQHAIDSIGREKIVGVILNRIDDRQLDAAAYYDYYYNRAPVRARDGQLSSI